MIRCLHVIGSRNGGGAETSYARLVNALAADAPDLDLLAVHRAGSAVCGLLAPGVRHAHVAMWSVLDPIARLRLRTLAGRRTPTIVQTYLGRATRLVHLPRRTGMVHIARMGGFYEVRQYRHAHALVGNSRAVCEHARKGGFPPERVFHIGPFVDPPPPLAPDEWTALRDAWGLPRESLVVVVVARLHPVKGLADLLHAWATVSADTSLARSPRLVFVGDGPLRDELRQQAQALGLADRVVWAGWQDHPHRFFAVADLAVCPSHREGLGNVILEAWAAGRPVLSTRTHGGEELITHDRDGWLVPVGDPASLAEALGRLLRDETLRQRLAAGGAATLAGRHRREVVVAAYRELYRQALEWTS